MIVRLFHVGLLPASARKPAALKNACRRTLRGEKADRPGELNVIFLDRKRMLELNKRYLNHDYDTDVIAFNYPSAGKGSPGDSDEPFGDVFVSAHQARVQAKQMGHPVLTEVLTLIIHGTLHLLGYDDSTPRKKAAMFRKQEALLKSTSPQRRARLFSGRPHLSIYQGSGTSQKGAEDKSRGLISEKYLV